MAVDRRVQNWSRAVTVLDQLRSSGPIRLRRAQAAQYCNVSVGYLEKAAVRGDGPPMYRLSRKLVLYDAAELDRWLAERRVGSTSEASAGNTIKRTGG